jgi:CRISPR system Cascade subunit CasB
MREQEFINALVKLEPGDRARLRRHAGKTLNESVDVLGVFFRVLPYGVSERQHQAYFLVATLFPLADRSDLPGNFGVTLSRMRNSNNEAGLNRRVAALLDADEQQLPFRLRQLVRLAYANRVGVNWARLLRDVLGWSHPDRWVQKEWAMAYFSKARREQSQQDDEADSSDDA